MANALATQTRTGLATIMAQKYNMEPGKFAEVVKATCMPGNVTEEEFIAFMMVAHEYGLNPLLRQIYAFPKKGGGIQPIVGIDGWINLVHQHKDLDGIEFEHSEGSCTCRIYRKGMRSPIAVTEYLSECKRNTDPWNQMPQRMLRHKALIQCARVAFGFSGIMDEEEGETIKRAEGEVVATQALSSSVSRTEQVKRQLKEALPPAPEQPDETPQPTPQQEIENLPPPAEVAELFDDPNQPNQKGKRGRHKPGSAVDAIKGN